MSTRDIAVSATGLGKRFKIYADPMNRLLERVLRRKRHDEKWAFRDVSFEVPRGSALGVVGANGAGKSTLLKVIGGITPPTEGTYRVDGRLGSLHELGVGFHPEFTGRANVFMSAAIKGIPKEEVKERFHEVEEFSELGSAMNEPVRTYSSGMAMRLGFSVALLAKPEVLMLDEVMAVGDQHFQAKCMERIGEIRTSGTTILFVSHSMYHIRQMCNQAIWIDEGKVMATGDPTRVTDAYVSHQFSRSIALDDEEDDVEASEGMPRLGELHIGRPDVPEPADVFATHDVMELRFPWTNPSGKGRYHIEVSVRRNDGIRVFSTTTRADDILLSGPGAVLRLRVPIQLAAGDYHINGRLVDESGESLIQHRKVWGRFKVHYDGMEKGLVLADCRWMTLDEAAR